MSTLSLLQYEQKKEVSSWVSIGLGAMLFWVCANFKMWLPLSPVPITMHTFAIFILGALLSFRQSLLSLALVYLMGLLQIPFLGAAITFSGVCVGYYIGWIAALFLISTLKERIPLLPLLFFVSNVVILGFGFLHLQSLFGAFAAWKIGVLPFLLGDTLKVFGAYFLIKKWQRKSSSLSL